MVTRKQANRSAKGGPKAMERRHLLLAGILALWVAALAARLYDLQIIQYVRFLNRAQRQQQRTVEVVSKRGTIYDREARPLAMSLAVDSIYAVPAEMPNPEMVVGLLEPILGLPPGELHARFKGFHAFCWVKRKVTSEEAARVKELNLKGVYFQKEMKRFYPKGQLAAHILGGVGLDDGGLAGIEYSEERALQSRPAHFLVALDAHGQSYRSTGWDGQPGKDLVLTLDENIQYVTEKALAEAMARWHSASGTVIVQNPYTGEILALANQPAYGPGDFSNAGAPGRVDRAVSMVYEPGSTFKLVTLAATLEENLATPGEVIDCQEGSIVLAGHVIHDHKPFGALTVEQVLAHSSDVGAIKLALRLGKERFYRYIRAFGFGAKTGIELPGEERGLLNPPERWSGISIGEMAIGQEVGVTPLQLVTSYSAIANGGILYQPRIVRDVFRGAVHDPIAPAAGRRVVSERTAALMKQMLAEVVHGGTGIPAQLAGYTVAGKTGTAQKIDPSGSYSKSHYVSSFVGFAPVERPAVTILVVIDSPQGAIYGSEVAAPVFRAIAEQTLGYLNIPHDNPSGWLQVASRAPFGPSRQRREGPRGFLPTGSEASGAAPLPVRRVSLTNGSPGAVPQSGTLVLDSGASLSTPDFSSLAVRRVAEQCERLGLEMSFTGTGLAVEQAPPPGTPVPLGAQVWVRFAR